MLELPAVKLDAKGLAFLLSALLGWLAFKFVFGVFKWLRARSILTRFPSPPGHWLLGHLPHLVAFDHHKNLLRWADELGHIYYVRFLWQHALVVTDPVLAAEVLGTKTSGVSGWEKPIKNVHSHINYFVSKSGQPNLFSSYTNEEYRLVRKGVAPAFNSKNIREGFRHVLSLQQQLVAVLKVKGPDKPVDIDNAAQRESLDVIGRFGFGKDFNATKSLEGGHASVALDILLAGCEEFTLRWTNPLRQYQFYLPGKRAGDAAYRKFQRLMEDLLEEIQARGPPSPDDATVAAHLRRIRDPSGRPLSHDRLAAEIGVIFVGGFETSGHTIAWTLYLISQHPEVEARVVAELDQAGLLASKERPKPRALEFEDLSRLPYLNACLKESMRVYPVATDALSRRSEKEMQLGGMTIPANTLVWFQMGAVHNSSHNWELADKFLPERWFDENVEYALPPNTKPCSQLPSTTEGGPKGGLAAGGDGSRPKRFLPFSQGVRDCPGQALAKMNAMAVLAGLLSHFSFTLAEQMGGPEGVKKAEVCKLALQPGTGMWMHCKPRA